MAAAIKGYKLKLIMPSNMSEERRSSMRAYGAELTLVSAGAMEEARDMAQAMQVLHPCTCALSHIQSILCVVGICVGCGHNRILYASFQSSMTPRASRVCRTEVVHSCWGYVDACVCFPSSENFLLLLEMN